MFTTWNIFASDPNIQTTYSDSFKSKHLRQNLVRAQRRNQSSINLQMSYIDQTAVVEYRPFEVVFWKLATSSNQTDAVLFHRHHLLLLFYSLTQQQCKFPESVHLSIPLKAKTNQRVTLIASCHRAARRSSGRSSDWLKARVVSGQCGRGGH